nr:hypothetical protein [Clostridia bacterium]
MELNFFSNRLILDKQYTDTVWLTESGLDPKELEEEVLKLEQNLDGRTKSYIKAKTAELLMAKGQITVLGEDIFQEKLNARDIMTRQRNRWWSKTCAENFREDNAVILKAGACGAYGAYADFGHTSANTKMLTKLGLSGVIENLEKARDKHESLTAAQRDFYENSITVLKAMTGFCIRLSECEGISAANAEALRSIASGAPKNMYEAMQLIVIYFYIHEFIMGTRVRTLGRLDEVFLPFYENDLKNGTLTKESAKELWYYFLNKLWTMHVPYDLPFCIGGIGESGEETTNELSYLIVEAYNDINIYSPKIHVRVSPKTPPSFVKLILKCIR